MAFIAKIMVSSKNVFSASKIFFNISLTAAKITSSCDFDKKYVELSAGIHTSVKKNFLMEFFDEEKNWGADKIKVGRAWKKDELRIKSNEDLHKLWYVLLKERNMLLTMEYVHNKEYQYFPNPERIDKVEESMKNLEHVVRERNKAFYELETGHDGERPVKLASNPLGLRFRYKLSQHFLPRHMNAAWHKNYNFKFGGYAVRKFLNLYREKIHIHKLREKNRRESKVRTLLRLYPNMNIKALQAQFPEVDVEKVKTFSRSRGHYIPK